MILPFRGCFGQALFSPFFASGFQNGANAVQMNIKNTMKKKKTKRKLKRSQDKGYSTKGAQISSAYSFVIIAIFFAAPFHRSSKWLAACCLMASRFLVFFLFGVVLARPFFPQFSPVDSKTVQRSALCRSRRELSNEYVRYCYGHLSKFSFFSLSPCPFSQSSFRTDS